MLQSDIRQVKNRWLYCNICQCTTVLYCTSLRSMSVCLVSQTLTIGAVAIATWPGVYEDWGGAWFQFTCFNQLELELWKSPKCFRCVIFLRRDQTCFWHTNTWEKYRRKRDQRSFWRLTSSSMKTRTYSDTDGRNCCVSWTRGRWNQLISNYQFNTPPPEPRVLFPSRHNKTVFRLKKNILCVKTFAPSPLPAALADLTPTNLLMKSFWWCRGVKAHCVDDDRWKDEGPSEMISPWASPTQQLDTGPKPYDFSFSRSF